MDNGGVEAITRADPVYGPGVDAMTRPPAALGSQPYVRIAEQPASKALRYRYECEGRSAGSIPGVNSTPERKTYPTIEIVGHRGPAIIVVSCVTREEPFKPHPHNLVGRERCDKGVCTVKTSIGDDNKVSFSNLGIQCVKRKDIADALKTREQLRVDPFKTGFSHRNQPQSIDLNAVRLCFQVFVPDERTGKIRLSLPPVVSDIIYDKKAMSDLVIMRMSQCSATPRGGTEIFLLCEKVVREDIAVVFFQKEGDTIVWEESANIILVHKQVAIAFHVPPYQNPLAAHRVEVYIQLKRTSDNSRSNAVPFTYTPDYQDSGYLKLKRKKVLNSLMAFDERSYMDQQIKSEPRDKTPPHAMGSPRAVAGIYNEHEHIPDNTHQQWNMHNLAVAGPSHLQPYQDVDWGQNYAQLSPSVPTMSPNEASMSPGMQMSPNVQMSPLGPTSPMMRASPMERISPMPNMAGAISPNMHQMTTLGHMSPNLVHMGHNIVQQQQVPQHVGDPMETGDTPSFRSLLQMDRGDIQLSSTDLSSFMNLLPGQAGDLSDSLNKLSTSEFFPS